MRPEQESPPLNWWIQGLWTRPISTFARAAQQEHAGPALGVVGLTMLVQALHAVLPAGAAATVAEQALDRVALTLTSIPILAGLQVGILFVACRLMGWPGSLLNVARCYGLAWAASLGTGLVTWFPALLNWQMVYLALTLAGETWYWALLFIGVRTFSRLPTWRVVLCIAPMLIAIDFPLLIQAFRHLSGMG